MAQYINKDALVAEIERRLDEHKDEYKHRGDIYASVLREEDEDILSFLDTLEVKEECKIGETKIYLNDDGGEPPYDGKQWLDLSCTEWEIPVDKFKDGDDVEIIIRKIQKGE